MNTILLGLLLWVAASVPLSLLLAVRMRGVSAREGRTHRAVRVSRPAWQERQPRETRSLAQLRTRVSVSGIRTARAARAAQGRRRLRRGDVTVAA